MQSEAVMYESELRATDSIARAGDWSLVLHSAGINHRLDIRDGRIVIVVSPDDEAAASAALAAYDAESVPGVEAPIQDLGPSPLGLACVVILIALHVAAGARDARTASVWFHAGSASAAAIVHGEWWRAVTALMLHADVLHLVGNVIGALVFVSAVGRWLGAGLGGAVILASAAAANMMTAWFYQDGHVSIGASTATFAALGVLAGLQVVRRFRFSERRRQAWFPLAAGLGLIVMLGSSERADLVAHVCGLGAGVASGLLVAITGLRTPGRVMQAMLTALTLSVVAGSWYIALRAL